MNNVKRFEQAEGMPSANRPAIANMQEVSESNDMSPPENFEMLMRLLAFETRQQDANHGPAPETAAILATES